MMHKVITTPVSQPRSCFFSVSLTTPMAVHNAINELAIPRKRHTNCNVPVSFSTIGILDISPPHGISHDDKNNAVKAYTAQWIPVFLLSCVFSFSEEAQTKKANKPTKSAVPTVNDISLTVVPLGIEIPAVSRKSENIWEK